MVSVVVAHAPRAQDVSDFEAQSHDKVSTPRATAETFFWLLTSSSHLRNLSFRELFFGLNEHRRRGVKFEIESEKFSANRREWGEWGGC
jgi:hypothetical protein